MPILIRSTIEIIKTLIASIVSSVLFSFMIYSEIAISDSFACLILNTLALLLFFYINFYNWSHLYEDSSTAPEYFVPSIASVSVYAILSSYLYSKRFTLYMWFFLPTRFLEPKLSADFAYLSIIIAYVLLLALVFVTPIFFDRGR